MNRDRWAHKEEQFSVSKMNPVFPLDDDGTVVKRLLQYFGGWACIWDIKLKMLFIFLKCWKAL